MDDVNIVLCGLGGQGILFMTKIFAQAALSKGFNLMGAETHGMAQRGGSVVSHLRLGEVENSLIRTGTAQFLLALEETEAYRNIPFLAKGGRLYSDASISPEPRDEIRTYLDRMEISYRSVPAGMMAMELDIPMSSNLILLGFFASFEEEPVSYNDLRATIENASPDKFRELNLKAFDAGFHKGPQ